uniref:Light-independent protochlorophyllide reductase subunit B n=1 Tax=Bracteacoccus aerius TaxID=50041 RepID=A0A140HAT1_9CHLO|nr:protochlorophyllide reductase subunit B [Bracteacoccus aerius]AMO01280.1 protochlorophyllide reductase subunit B [Bracteacoccus aerius]
MKLAYWMYAGPAHIGTLRVASSFKNVHAIMHAPLGDDYFNVMRSMLERERDFTPVTASIVDRHVLARGSQEKVVENITRKDKEECPDLILLTPTCTSSILQEDLQNFVERASLESECDVILADVNHYRVNELQAADRTLEQIVRFYIEKAKKQIICETETIDSDLWPLVDRRENFKEVLPFGSNQKGEGEVKLNSRGVKNAFVSYPPEKTKKPSANILGIFTLGFHNQHDCREIKRLLNDLGIEINEIIPEGGSVSSLKNLPKAWFNIVPYREVGLMTAVYLEKEFGMPYVSTTPMGVVDTANFIREIESILKNMKSIVHNESELYFDFDGYIDRQTRFISQAAWFSRSIDCQNLTGKRAVVFGDSTHAASMTKILAREMGIRVACAGTYCKHDADWFREQVFGFCDQVLITEDHTQVGDMIAQLEPAAIFGTQMERHVGKRLDIPCGVISAPVHIQNFPLGYRPFLGYEGTNQIADLVYNSFSLGMEDHLLEIFGGHDTKEVITKSLSTDSEFTWAADGLSELNKIPGFVRGKVKRNTEKFARQNNIQTITVEVMFAAKEAAGA